MVYRERCALHLRVLPYEDEVIVTWVLHLCELIDHGMGKRVWSECCNSDTVDTCQGHTDPKLITY
jgi:hypothetical protein